MLERRTLILAGLLSGTSLVPVRAQGKVTVIYVGGWDCPPCITWKNQHKADWLKSPEHSKVEYIEIESPKLREAYQDRYWPEVLRPIRNRLPRQSGTPRFIVVKDGEIVANEWGAGDWARAWAKIRAAVS